MLNIGVPLQGLAITKLFFLNSVFLKDYLFEMSKFKETTREGKIQKLVKNQGASWLKPIHVAKEISNTLLTTFLYPIGGTLCFPIFAKRSNTKCCKVSHYVRGSVPSPENLPKKEVGHKLYYFSKC